MMYRKEIDGLRAVAVVPVVLFHSGLPGFSGGYAGVDVFFVISGFLITALLLQDLQQDRFSIVKFYERRARRILPALTFVILITTLIAAFTLPPLRLAEYGASLIATVLFGANLYFWRTTDYFATAAEERPLLHMWSLAVEEQFYIIFPLLLLALWRWRRGGSDAMLWAVFLGSAVLSFALSVFAAEWKPVANFYLPVTRAWELLAGCMVALALKGAPPRKAIYAPVLAGLGLVLVIGALILIDETTPWPGPWTIVPVAGTALILLFARADCPTGRTLGWGPLVWIGLLSYSIYLWHQPLLAFARITTPAHPPLALMAALALATIPLAWISWRFVEQPFRKRPSSGGFSRQTIFAGSAAILVGVTALGLVPIVAPRLMDKLYTLKLTEEDVERYTTLQDIVNPEQLAAFKQTGGDLCRVRFEMVTPQARELFRRCTENGERAVIITGGSHAIDLYVALTKASQAEVIIAFARGYCRPHRRLRSTRPNACPFEGVRDLVATHPDRIGLVLYTQAGFTVFDTYRNTRSADGLHMELVEEVGDYLASLAVHVPVLALGSKPFLGGDPRHLSISAPLVPQLAQMQDAGIADALFAVDQAFSDAFAARGVAYMSHDNAIGTLLPDEVILQNRLTYRDADHWSLHGAQIFGTRLLTALSARGYADLFTPQVPGGADIGGGTGE
jgi:peptidoglycan/LPS O-acetylase OafA/YrhL